MFYRLEIPCAGCQTPQQNSMQSVQDLQTGLCQDQASDARRATRRQSDSSPRLLNRWCGLCSPKKGHTRKPVIIKSYLAVFVCFSTKAIHLEVVSDLTTEAFLACLRRFISKKGCPSTIQSDNGSNFKGAKNDLQELYRFLKKTATDSSVAHYLSSQLIQWTMIPEKSPHFGGLWEAAVKSAKFHLKRIVGLQHLTFEEFTTITCQVEACLNSRPLLAITSHDTDGVSTLTSGHFLIGRPLTAYPETYIPQDPSPG